MKHTLSVLLQNESGALVHLVGLFAARHCNIDSLTVATTKNPAVSRLTMVVQGSPALFDQIVRQTCKLIDVIDVSIPSLSSHNTTMNLAERP